jgi:hypothetical protein
VGCPSDRVPDGSLHILAKGKKKDGDRRRQTRALSVRFDPLARLDGKGLVPWDVERAIDALAEIWRSDRAGVENDNFRRLVVKKLPL